MNYDTISYQGNGMLELLPHSRKVAGLTPGISVISLHVFHSKVFLWVLFPSNDKTHIQYVKVTDNFKLPQVMGETEWLSVCGPLMD